jgi:peptidylprolyl isomerase
MTRQFKVLPVLLLSALSSACVQELATTAAVTESLETSDWRTPNAEDLLYVQLPHGEVVIELTPVFAPRNVENIRTLAREHYYDGLAVIRSHDNYVVQWGDPADDSAQKRSIGSAAATVAPEFFRAAADLEISSIDSRDAYADKVGFSNGFPVGSDDKRIWLAHCYGMVGVARGMQADSGNGTSLYVVTGHAPRHLDRNISLVGRVLTGMEHLSALPRGAGALGFYESGDGLVPIVRVRDGDDRGSNTRIEVMRTDTKAFKAYVSARTTRTEEWFVDPGGRIGLCNIHPPVRVTE